MNEQDKSADRQHDENKLDENKLIAERRGKLADIREQRNAFPNNFRRSDDTWLATAFSSCDFSESLTWIVIWAGMTRVLSGI